MQLSDPLIVIVFHCRLARPHQLFFSGTVRGESAMTSLEDIGSPVDFEFVVSVKIWDIFCQQKNSEKGKEICQSLQFLNMYIFIFSTGCQSRPSSADARLGLPQHHVALRAAQWEVAPVSCQLEIWGSPRHTVHPNRGLESSEATQLLTCRTSTVCQSHCKQSKTLFLTLLGVILTPSINTTHLNSTQSASTFMATEGSVNSCFKFLHSYVMLTLTERLIYLCLYECVSSPAWANAPLPPRG